MHPIKAIAAFAVAANAMPATSQGVDAKKVSPQFYLKTQLKSGAGAHNHRFNNTYVTPYHTGAGENDVYLVKAPPTAVPSYLNGSMLQFNFTGQTFPYTLQNPTLTQYTAWQPSEVNAGYGENPEYNTFFINGSGLQWTTNSGDAGNQFAGWLVCDWWHEVPQLFWTISFYEQKFPSTCSIVDLIPVSVNEK